MKMKKFIIGLNYGCQLEPAISYLQAKFPDFEFKSGHDTDFAPDGRPQTSSGWVIYIEVDSESFRVPDWNLVHMVAEAFRDGHEKGYDRAATEAEKSTEQLEKTYFPK